MGALAGIGGVLPVLTGVTSVLGAVDRAASAVHTFGGGDQVKSDKLALRQLQARQTLEAQQNADKTALEKQRLTDQAAADEDSRQAALRRAVARQRAQFGAQGIGSTGGSAQAVLLGLFDESEADREQRERQDSLRAQALDLTLEQDRSLNLLQATQLAQKAQLRRYLV